MPGALDGRVAIVTGASAGIGRATALTLAAEGAAVVVHARREERLGDLVADIEKAGGRALSVPGDASAHADPLFDRALEFAGQLRAALDIVVVNAGRGLAGGLLSSDKAQWQSMFELNVLGAAALMRRAGEHMVALGHGDIVTLGSLSGHNISPFSGFYGSTKFAIAGMTEAFRREICSRGVRVTIIKPGLVLSEFQAAAGYTYDNFYKNAERFGKLLQPQDVADAIRMVVTQPRHIHLSEIIIRPTGQDYP